MKIDHFIHNSLGLSGTQADKARNFIVASGVTEVTALNKKELTRYVQKLFRPDAPVLRTVAPLPEVPGVCPVCKKEMQRVKLLNDREVYNCQQHSIALPLKVSSAA